LKEKRNTRPINHFSTKKSGSFGRKAIFSNKTIPENITTEELQKKECKVVTELKWDFTFG